MNKKGCRKIFIKRIWPFLNVYFSPNTILFPRDMTCCVSTVLCKVRMLCPLFLTQISLSFYVKLFSLLRNKLFWYPTSQFESNTKIKANDVRTVSVHTVGTKCLYLNATTLFMVHIFSAEMSILNFQKHVMFNCFISSHYYDLLNFKNLPSVM